MNVNGKATLVGIVSWASDPYNCPPEYPVVFTDVSKYTDWIDEIVITIGAILTWATGPWHRLFFCPTPKLLNNFTK